MLLLPTLELKQEKLGMKGNDLQQPVERAHDGFHPPFILIQ